MTRQQPARNASTDEEERLYSEALKLLINHEWLTDLLTDLMHKVGPAEIRQALHFAEENYWEEMDNEGKPNEE